MSGRTVRTAKERAVAALRRPLARPADPELDEVRKRARRLRRRLKETRAELAEVRAELRATRASVRDPDPTVVLPDEVGAVIDQVVAERLTYLSRADLAALARMVRAADLAGRPGLVVEAGTALGGSAIAMAAAKAVERPMKVYDVFGMIPPPSERDGQDIHERYETIVSGQSAGVGGDAYYGYHDDLYAEVTTSFRRLGVEAAAHHVDLVQGLFEDTIDLDEPVAFAHLDGDWYDSTMVCLERIAPLLVPGGRIVLDDYYHWSGCQAAVHDYFDGRSGYRLERRARVHVVRL